MSSVHLVIRDHTRQIEGDCHGAVCDCAIAALCDQPETIEELDAAMNRFIEPRGSSHFVSFRSGDLTNPREAQPCDAGLVVVDLTARMVMSESMYSTPMRAGCLHYHDGSNTTEFEVGYHLSSDWEFARGSSDWAAKMHERRKVRQARPPVDVRAVLYGRPVIEFFVRQCIERSADPIDPEASHEPDDPEQRKRVERDRETIRAIHALWMLTPREDLEGRCPREAIMRESAYIDACMQDREEQWSLMRQCPPGLDRQSAAYRFAPFGTTEKVFHYELLREWLWYCRQNVGLARGKGIALDEAFVEEEIVRLEQFRDAWLVEPNYEFEGAVPGPLIDNERARIPEGRSGEEMMFDCDCPLCRMEAESGHIGFFHYDGSGIDDDFAFDIRHDTLEQWEQEQLRYADMERRWREEEAARTAAGDDRPTLGADRIWKSSYSAPPSPSDPPEVRLMSIGMHLMELVNDLKEPTESRDLIDRLNRDFGNLVEVVQRMEPESAGALFEPVLARLGETLDTVSAARPDLQAKCSDLDRQVSHLADPCDPCDPFEGGELNDEDIPY